MKYVWIVMLIIGEIIWFIFSLKDFIETFAKTARFFKARYVLESLEGYTIGFIIFNLCLLFAYSLTEFIKGLY